MRPLLLASVVFLVGCTDDVSGPSVDLSGGWTNPELVEYYNPPIGVEWEYALVLSHVGTAVSGTGTAVRRIDNGNVFTNPLWVEGGLWSPSTREVRFLIVSGYLAEPRAWSVDFVGSLSATGDEIVGDVTQINPDPGSGTQRIRFVRSNGG